MRRNKVTQAGTSAADDSRQALETSNWTRPRSRILSLGSPPLPSNTLVFRCVLLHSAGSNDQTFGC